MLAGAVDGDRFTVHLACDVAQAFTESREVRVVPASILVQDAELMVVIAGADVLHVWRRGLPREHAQRSLGIAAVGSVLDVRHRDDLEAAELEQAAEGGLGEMEEMLER